MSQLNRLYKLLEFDSRSIPLQFGNGMEPKLLPLLFLRHR